MYYLCTSFQWKWLTPWGVLQVAVRRIIRLVHRRIRTGRDIYRTGCFLFSVSVRVTECRHLCTTFAATWRCGTAGWDAAPHTQTASDLWRIRFTLNRSWEAEIDRMEILESRWTNSFCLYTPKAVSLRVFVQSLPKWQNERIGTKSVKNTKKHTNYEQTQ